MAIEIPFRGYWRAGPVEGGDGKFYAGDRVLVLVAVLNRNYPKAEKWAYWESQVIVATEDGWNDSGGESWSAWSWDDVSWWVRLNRDVLPAMESAVDKPKEKP